MNRRNLGPGLALLGCLAAGAVQHAMAQEDLLWLEAPKEAKALTWAREHTQATRKALSALPSYAAAASELKAVLDSGTPLADVSLFGDKAVRLQHDAKKPNGVLQVAQRDANGVPGAWRTVLDVDALRAKEGKPYELQWYQAQDLCLPPQFDRCLLRLSGGGSDEVELREFDLKTGQFVGGGFAAPQSRFAAAWIDQDHVLVSHTLGKAPRTAAGWGAAVYLWKRGEPVSSAKEVFKAQPTDAIVQLSSVGRGNTRYGIVSRVIDYSTFELSIVDRAGKVTLIDLPYKLKPFGLLGATARHLIVQLAEPAKVGGRSLPAETLVAYDVSSGLAPEQRTSVVYQPAQGEYVGDVFGGFAAAGDSVAFIVNRDLVPRLITARVTGKGWTAADLYKGEAGVTLAVTSADPVGDDVVVHKSGFLVPGRLELLRPGRQPAMIETEKSVFDASRFVSEIKSVASKDGTSIDYYLLRPRDIAKGSATPTLMTGYGAFGISLKPGYLDATVGGRAFKLWLDRGGALVIPAIRGGGERGTAWQRAAMREKRQVSYDDFIAVAESLIKSGFTRPDRLGVFGMSNGGLLSATVSVERPDLFGAVVSDVPLTDMLRFPKMGMGGAWTDEYGNPDDPRMAKVLRAYSPLQNVKEGVKYPPFMVTVSTEDDRVGPGHARKLAARLQQVGAPVYFYESEEGGHGASDPLKNPELMALRMTFFIDYLMGKQPARAK